MNGTFEAPCGSGARFSRCWLCGYLRGRRTWLASASLRPHKSLRPTRHPWVLPRMARSRRQCSSRRLSILQAIAAGPQPLSPSSHHGPQVVLGEPQLLKLRGKAISIHSQEIKKFCADCAPPGIHLRSPTTPLGRLHSAASTRPCRRRRQQDAAGAHQEGQGRRLRPRLPLLSWSSSADLAPPLAGASGVSGAGGRCSVLGGALLIAIVPSCSAGPLCLHLSPGRLGAVAVHY